MITFLPNPEKSCFVDVLINFDCIGDVVLINDDCGLSGGIKRYVLVSRTDVTEELNESDKFSEYFKFHQKLLSEQVSNILNSLPLQSFVGFVRLVFDFSSELPTVFFFDISFSVPLFRFR
ncbi:hypothetical protein GEMRC1_003829 [Eukaryota sp. GEM-RC1]